MSRVTRNISVHATTLRRTQTEVELDGGQHSEAVDYDEARTQFLLSRGYKVMRFWNGTVKQNLAGVLYALHWELDVRTGKLPDDSQR
jgi:very-short-patch-repair endonuclease